MNKKKAIKLTTASMLTASSFAAVAPFTADAASSTATYVADAAAKAKAAQEAYTVPAAEGKAETAAAVQKQVNVAVKAYDKAFAAVEKYTGKDKALLQSKLEVAKRAIDKAKGYVAGKTLAEGLNKQAAQLKKDVTANNLQAVKTALPAFSTELQGAEAEIKEVVSGEQAENVIIATLSYSKKVEVSAKAYVAVPTVTNVTAVNAKTVVVNFSKAIDASTIVDTKSTTVTTDDTVVAGSVKFTAIDGQTAVTSNDVLASLSADGKTLTLTAKTGESFTKRFTVDVANTVKDTTGQALVAFSQILDTNDSVRPVVVGTSYEDNGLTLKVKFSEALQSRGTIKLFNGTTELSVTPTFTAGNDYVLIPLGSSTIPVNTNLKLQIVGAVDYNGNTISPNPYEATVVKATSDTTSPTVTGVQVVNDKVVKVTFSEKLNSTLPTISIGGVAATVAADADDTTGLVYTATLSTAQSGLKAVAVSAFTDLAGNVGDAYSKVVSMVADTTAPTLVSSEVKKVDGVEKLILTFNEYVTPQNTVQVLSTSDRYINTDGISVLVPAAFTTNTSSNFALYGAVNGKSKSVALDITALNKGTYTVSLPSGLVKDLASTPVSYAEAKSITFVRTENALTTKPALDSATSTNGVTVVDNNTLEFKFTQAVNNSALNLANYNIDGISLASAVFYGNNQTVRVTLANNANTVTGTRTITVKNISNSSGIVMDTAITTEDINENVAPTFTASLVADDVIKVSFSEAVANPTISSAIGTSNFAVTVDGVAATVSAVNADNVSSPTAAAAGKGYTTLYVKLSSAVTDLTDPITITASGLKDATKTGTIVAADIVGNTVSSATVTVSK